MRILFKTLSHADRFLRVCRQNLDDVIRRDDDTRLPSQRIANIFCQCLGYGSYDDLERHQKTASTLRPTPPGKAMVNAIKDGFANALSLAATRGFKVLELADGEPMPDWLGMYSVLQYAEWLDELRSRQREADPIEAKLSERAASLIGAAMTTVIVRVTSVDYIYKQYGAKNPIDGPSVLGELGLALIKYGIKETGKLIDPDGENYRSGRYLYAAVWAAKNGRKSVDAVLRTHVPEEIDEAWGLCAEATLSRMQMARVENLRTSVGLECYWCLNQLVKTESFESIEMQRERARKQGWTAVSSTDIGEHQDIPRLSRPSQPKVDVCPRCSRIHAYWTEQRSGRFPEDFPAVLIHRLRNEAARDIEHLERVANRIDYSYVGDELLKVA